jgi:CRISPR-associated protein Cmr4
MNYLTYTYLLTPLHTGASSQAGNLLGIAREAQTELPYLPSSSIRGKLRSVLETLHPHEAGTFMGERIKDGQQPTEGEVWFADATLLLFPVASYSHQFLWITCPLWLSRWNRWLQNASLKASINDWRSLLNQENGKSVITALTGGQIYLKGAVIETDQAEAISSDNTFWKCFQSIPDEDGILDLKQKLIILSDEDCATFVETGLQREVRVTIGKEEKVVVDGSFRSEEAVPSETVLFFPWGLKSKDTEKTTKVRQSLHMVLNDRIQFGGLEGLGRGWTQSSTIEIISMQGEE